nr:hypothetical protein [uncultured bacterium]
MKSLIIVWLSVSVVATISRSSLREFSSAPYSSSNHEFGITRTDEGGGSFSETVSPSGY